MYVLADAMDSLGTDGRSSCTCRTIRIGSFHDVYSLVRGELTGIRDNGYSSVTSSIMDYEFENGRRYHAYKAGRECQILILGTDQS